MNKNLFIKIIGIIILILLALWLHNLFSSPNYDSNDNKCDICGKKYYQKINGEEYCKEHYLNAFKYYYNIK